MCGIAGIWNVDCEQPLSRAQSMLDAMRHRGPDGRGTLEFAGGAAGMVRLALVDLSDRGQQPLWSADRRVAILFNGEVYNFRQERMRLEQQGVQFRTTTDTEVVLQLYLERGLAFHEHLRGMFAVAIFDWRESTPNGRPVLLLARDPLGIKPLYLAHPHGQTSSVVFASELRGLLASGLVAREVSRVALADYLAHGFVQQPSTMIEGVRLLEPGTLERYAPGRSIERQRFWRMPAYQPQAESLDESAARLRSVLEESIQLHALADAPIGAFLSGGIDSTGVVALMRPHVADLRTYTVRFPDVAGADEVGEAAAAAAALDCRHTVVEITGREVRELLPRFAGDLDQPSTDGLNTWLISRAAARDVKGVLSGLGGDEWFAGYPVTRRMSRYQATLAGRAQALAGRLAHQAAPLLPRTAIRQRVENLGTRRSALATWGQTHQVFSDETAGRLVGLDRIVPSSEAQLAAAAAYERDDWQRESMVGLSCLLDAGVYMRSQLLRDSDAASMAHSLELRVPLVDLRVAEFSRSCADEFKLLPDGGSNGQYAASGSKKVLIHALADVLSRDIDRRPKRGFALPYEAWLQGPLQSMAEEAVSSSVLLRRGLINPQVAESVGMTPTIAKTGKLYPRLWSMIILEYWCQAVLDHVAPSPASKPLVVA